MVPKLIINKLFECLNAENLNVESLAAVALSEFFVSIVEEEVKVKFVNKLISFLEKEDYLVQTSSISVLNKIAEIISEQKRKIIAGNLLRLLKAFFLL